MPVHMYGHPADMPALVALAQRHGLLVIEDCAQSTGATYLGKRTGAWGDIACFSFYPTKNLGAIGDGGMVATNDAALAERVRLLRQYGWAERYVSAIAGWNTRLDEIQAAILRVKLRYLQDDNVVRARLAGLYDTMLAGTGLVLPRQRPGTQHVYHLYVVRSQRRDALQAHLRSAGVGALVHYPVPVHLQTAYLGRLRGSDTLKVTEAAAREILSLPMFPELTDDEVGTVVAAIRDFAAPR